MPKRFLQSVLTFLLLFLITGIRTFSQTNPAALTLPVNENFGTSSFSTPKPGMASWTGDGTRPYGTQATAEASLGGADLASISTSDPVSGNSGGQYGHAPSGNGRLTILQSSNSTNGTTQVVMAINTTGINNATISYDLVLTVPNPRDFGIALQYRVGTSGAFTTIDGSAAVYNSTSTNKGDLDGSSDFDNYSFSLPAGALNQAVVQLRWITWRPTSGTGSACGVGIDNISIISGAISPCTEPTAQPTALNLTPAITTVSGSFTAASPAADGYLVVRSSASSLSSQPVDGTSYSDGDVLGGGTVVASSASTSFNESGLNPNSTYYYFVYAYNASSCSGGPNYFTTTPLTGNTTTQSLAACTTPAAAPTNLNLTATGSAISGTFTASAGANRYLTVISSNATLSANPVNGITYSAGQSLGGGTIVSYTASTSFTATGLASSTLYYVFVFAANGECTGEPFYNTTALTGNKSTTTSGIPAGYYNAASGLTCSSLKTALYTIVSAGTTQLSYTPGVWDAFSQTDKRRNDANTADIVWDMYSDNPSGADPYTFTFVTNQCGNYSNEGDCYNREHSFPQSWFVNGTYPMYSDINHLFPTDGKVNGIRGNYPFGETSSPTTTTLNGSKLGPSSYPGYTGIVFEPIDAYKGDFARATLYMVTRYENLVAAWQSNGNADNILNGTSYPALDDWAISLLLKWHNQDPVSQKEIDRNNAVYAIQGNRNPFIDHPEYAAAIWQCTTPVTNLNLPDNFIKLYPNPVTTRYMSVQLQESFSTGTQAQIVDLTGKIISTTSISAGIKNFNLQVSDLVTGRYFVKLITKKGITTRSFVVQ